MNNTKPLKHRTISLFQSRDSVFSRIAYSLRAPNPVYPFLVFVSSKPESYRYVESLPERVKREACLQYSIVVQVPSLVHMIVTLSGKHDKPLSQQ